jgi:hypothetical protein
MACAALCLLYAPKGVRIDGAYPLFVLFSTAAAYNYMRLVQGSARADAPFFNYNNWLATHRQMASFLGAFFVTLSLFYLLKIWSLKLLVLLVFPAVLSIVYPLSFRTSAGAHFSVRMWPGIKLFIIASVWAYTVVLLPNALYADLSLFAWLDFFSVLLLVAGLTIPFDVRDLRVDDPAMRTLPAVLGEERALVLARFLLGIVQLYAMVAFIVGHWSWVQALSFIAALELGIALIKHMHSGRGEFYTAFWIEAIPIVVFLLYWIIQTLIPFL